MEDKKKRSDSDWESLLKDDEVGDDEKSGKTFVFLRGLQRIAREAGYCGSAVHISHVPIGGMGIFQAVYEARFDDGTTWTGTGDVNKANTTEEFMKFPTSVAESRAEARALRKALGISMLAFEEISGSATVSISPESKISNQVVKQIELMLKKRDVDLVTLFYSAVDKDRKDSVYDLKDLNVSEGQRAIQFLNKAGVSKSNRDKKKEELNRKLKDNE